MKKALKSILAFLPLTFMHLAWAQTLAVLEVRSQPPGAHVTVSGQYVGQTPIRLEMIPGNHTISIESPDGSLNAQAELSAGQRLEMNVNLGPNSYTLTRTSPFEGTPHTPTSSQVQMTGTPGMLERVQVTPTPGGGVEVQMGAPGSVQNLPYVVSSGQNLPPMTGQATGQVTGYTTRQVTGQPASSFSTSSQVPLSQPRAALGTIDWRSVGFVRFDTTPRSAQIHLFGGPHRGFLGITPTNLVPMQPGDYEVRYLLDGHEVVIYRFTVRIGEEQTIFATLQTCAYGSSNCYSAASSSSSSSSGSDCSSSSCSSSSSSDCSSSSCSSSSSGSSSSSSSSDCSSSSCSSSSDCSSSSCNSGGQ